MSIIETLTEGIVNRNMQQEGAALLNKWTATGLLEGISNEQDRANMAVLLENQAKSLLKESNTIAGGNVEGFAAVAFPIVRRVFAGLIANDLVSVQPMSLPSGLIFFLDFTFGGNVGAELTEVTSRLGLESGSSIYGQGVTGKDIIDGVKLNSATMDNQPYGLGSAYSSPTGSAQGPIAATADLDGAIQLVTDSDGGNATVTEDLMAAVEFDADVLAEQVGGGIFSITVTKDDLEAGAPDDPDKKSSINLKLLSQIVLDVTAVADSNGADLLGTTNKLVQVRRLTSYDADADAFTFYYLVKDDSGQPALLNSAGNNTPIAVTAGNASWPMTDHLKSVDGSLGAVVAGHNWGLEGESNIPEIDIKVDSVAITAVSKKLKAKWTPELGQDLNAYHNLDAEVELTSILSEQIALEIDREILQDLIKGATAGTYYWARPAGLFVNRLTGEEIGQTSTAPDFTGTVSEWYETLIETINDVSAQIHRKTLRGGANFCVVSPEVANILEFTAGFRANVTADADKGDIGAVKVGSLNRKFDVIVDPYFPRNAVLVGRKGSSFLESGYVYAPYVPLQTTPTIFGPEDFVPRKGVMTRYGKKMVRPDMYGLVIVRGLNG